MLYRVLVSTVVMLAITLSFASADEQSKKNGYFQVTTEFNFGFNGGPTDPMFAVDTLEDYGPEVHENSWKGLQIPLENARSYEDHIEPFFMFALKAGYKDFHFLMEAPLRKDLEAWYSSELKTNFTYNPHELDINVPLNAYGIWYNPVGFIQFGRFNPEDLKVSKNDILIGGLPYHDAIHWKFNVGIFRYDFMLSSLNAWLHGDVQTTTSCPPEGTEAYRQKCTPWAYQVSNQRRRVYQENVKNLVFHRFGFETKKVWFYVIEENVIGGKSLEFRMINPFMYLHDNYATGYVSTATSLELGYKTSFGSKFYGQLNMEDIASPVGELQDENHKTARSVINYMVGYFYELETRKYGKFSWRIDCVRTDPAANNSRLPLLKFTGRRNYRSNFRDQHDDDYADSFFADYPIGYRRGGDALDLWFDMGWKWGAHSASLTLAWLRQGDKEMYLDYEAASNADHTLSGVVEKQFLVDVLYDRRVNEWFKFYVGGGFRVYSNLAHDKNEDGAGAWIRSGVKFNFTPVDMKF